MYVEVPTYYTMKKHGFNRSKGKLRSTKSRHVLLLSMFIVSIPITGSVFTDIYFTVFEDQLYLKISGVFLVECLHALG